MNAESVYLEIIIYANDNPYHLHYQYSALFYVR
ncbi:hypothetical protein SAMN05216325_1358 [Nitrosomonas marina]|uniref:Uncharacterized protein n=1 Tax=Nitrosomonas marina TaxID=917 RepID=A0A1H8ILN1_9PROT|nr:hypothetical protein SAMN05216325_1358 [Nitrosomonas marina]